MTRVEQATGFVLLGLYFFPGNIQWGHYRNYLCLISSKPFLSEFYITQLSPKLVQGISSGFQSPCFKLFPVTYSDRMDCLTNYLALHPDFSQETLEFLCRPDTNSTLHPLTHFSHPQPTVQIIQIAPKRYTGNSNPQ